MNTKTKVQKLKEDGFLIFYPLGFNGYASGVYWGNKRQFPRRPEKKALLEAHTGTFSR